MNSMSGRALAKAAGAAKPQNHTNSILVRWFGSGKKFAAS
jgi:hypothetical protein